MGRGGDRGRAGARAPAEGTILTVARDMAHRIATELAHMPDPRLAPGSPDEVQDRAIAGVLERALEAGQESLRGTPQLLPVPCAAGVGDARGSPPPVRMA